MTFPRELMRMTEIQRECNLSRTLLFEAYLDPKQNFAFKLNPIARNSPILFQTAGLQEWLDKRPSIDQRARKRSYVM